MTRLRAVESGEAPDLSYGELWETKRMLERELQGYRLRLGRLERELATVQGSDPEAQDVKTVLSYWSKRVVDEGWWSRPPSFRPGHVRWSTVHARLKEGEPYTVEYLTTVVEGALMPQKGRKMKREWLDATSIFNSKTIEWHFERARDPECEWVRRLGEVPVRLRDRWVEVVEMADICDCQHLRLDHGKVGDGSWPCGVHGCICTAWTDFHTRAEEWLKSHT